MGWFVRGTAALVVLLAVGVGGIIVADRVAQQAPPDPAVLITRAKAYDARIRRDEFGIPHILGKRDADAAFGLAYAHAEDDFPTLQQVTLAVRGQLAATEGRKAAVTDYLVHLLRVWETVNAGYERDLPPDVRAVIEAYADGINYYAALHPDEVTLGLLPVTGRDIAAGFVFKTPFFYGLDKALLNLTAPGGGQSLAKSGNAAFLPSTATEEIGSNGVAVGPSRTTDGATRLLVNSHQPYSGPVAWYEAVVQSGEGWHVAGGFFPGTPFMLHGHNENLGWANTVDAPRLWDIYALKLNPANENQYLLDGAWKDFEVADAALRVKILGPLVWTVHRPVLWSAHGPVLKTDHGSFAIRYAGIGEDRQVLQYYRLDKARDLTEWKAALALQALPSINYIYADRAGNIGYVYNGLFPVRAQNTDIWHTEPGDRSDLIWHSYQPFDKVPQLWNPPSGFVFNSNNTPFQATAPQDDLKPENYPANMGIQTNMTNRAWRALETFGSQPKIDDAQFRADKFDLAYSTRSEIAALMTEIAALDAGADADTKAAQDLLARWDRSTDTANRAAALAILTARPVIEARAAGHDHPSLPESLHAAITTLKTHFGRIDPPWGDVNRIRRGTIDRAIDGGPDIFRAVYGTLQPDGTLTANTGDTLIMFVTWDRDGTLHSDSISQFGAASSRPDSPHYADQTALFTQMRTKPVLFTEAELAGHIKADYAPGDAHRSDQ
jgi:penicillin amidase/acyl-homoserine-lactone acylase